MQVIGYTIAARQLIVAAKSITKVRMPTLVKLVERLYEDLNLPRLIKQAKRKNMSTPIIDGKHYDLLTSHEGYQQCMSRTPLLIDEYCSTIIHTMYLMLCSQQQKGLVTTDLILYIDINNKNGKTVWLFARCSWYTLINLKSTLFLEYNVTNLIFHIASH